MTYVFDIDGTICTKDDWCDGDYEVSRPFPSRIAKINKLYDEGHTIIFLTARGMGRSKNSRAYAETAFYELTKQQLVDWGAKFHKLFLGKPAGDIYIDDRGMKDSDFFEDDKQG
tara:strand:- start:7126 stop:7467 length:342 start_codon:yes stop_codon:yes gene_type:complete